MRRIKSELFFILFLLVLIALVWLNEIGYGALAFLPLMLIEVWLATQIYRKERNSN
jgi:hypothetical protein